MSNDELAETNDGLGAKGGKDGPNLPSKRKPIHIDDIRAEARKKTKAAAESEGLSIERYEEIEKAIEEGAVDDFAREELEAVERIQASFNAETLALVRSVISQPWMQTYTASNMLKNAFGGENSSVLQNLKNVLGSQKSWNSIQSSFKFELPRNYMAGVVFPDETMRAIRNLAAPNQVLIESMPSLMNSFKGLRESLQSAARAALIAGFATKTQEFLTTDHLLRYRWNRPVWHYTNGHALLSILRNGQLWASSPENLNDSSEMTHGFEIIKQAFDDQVAKATELGDDVSENWETARDTLFKVLDEDYFTSVINDVYYISASAEQDSLTLWRNYADGDGFAVGIDAGVELSADGLAVDEANGGENIRGDVPLISGWYWVSYKKLEKQKLAQEFIQNAMADIDHTPDESLPSLVRELRKQAVILASVMKHEAFKDEREVRWMTTNFTTFDPVHYEHGRKSIVPVLHVMKASAEAEQPLPLKGLRCSPIPNDSIVRTMQGLLNQRGYAQASSNVKKSQQPFKG